jgi:predicted phosphodiesterase
MNMQDQIDMAVKLLEPIKDKILCILDGNHEERTKRVAGIDITSFMAFRLGVEEIYSTGTGAVLLDLKFGKGHRSGVKTASHHFTVVVAHGARSGVSIGSAATGLEGLQKIIVNADLYVIGHTHKILNFIKEVYFVNSYGFLETKIQYYINATAFLRYGDYGKDRLYPPTTIKPQAVIVRASEVKKLRVGNTNRTKQYFICDVKNI